MSDEKTVGIKGAQAGAATSATSARTGWKTKAKKVLPWVAGALIATALLVWWTGGASTTDSATAGGGDSASIWWLALAVLAILGTLGRGGKGGKAGLAAAFCVVVFYVGQDIYYKSWYGPQAEAVKEAQYEREAAEEITDLDNDEENSTNINNDGTGKQIFVVSENEWSRPTRIVAGRCFIAWTSDPSKPRNRTQVSTLAAPNTWVEIGGAAGMKIAWVRHSSRGPGTTTIVQEIRKDGNCS
jgi:hypothetical protein